MILFGCSGPMAAETIARSQLIGLLAFAGAFALAVAVALLVRVRGRWVAILAAAAHPGWWLSALHGDCGYLLRYASVTATVAFAAVSAWAIWRWRVRLPAP